VALDSDIDDPSGVGDPISTARLLLSPLVPADADEMVAVLSDDRLHEFIGGQPADLDGLRARYRRLVAGPSQPGERRRTGPRTGTMRTGRTAQTTEPTSKIACRRETKGSSSES